MGSKTNMPENGSAAHKKGMGLKSLIERYKKRRRDAGMGMIDAIAGVALAAIIIGGPILYFVVMNNNAAGNASTQSQNTAISEALDRAVANVQASDSIVYAGPNELVTRSTEVEEGKADKPVVTRWVVDGTTFYRQSWSGTGTGPTTAAGYNRTTPTSDTTVTSSVVSDLKLDGDLFTYTGKDGTDISVKAPNAALTENARTNPADGKKTYDIALVNLAIKAGTSSSGGKTGLVEAKTSAAPRSVSGKASGDEIDVPMCPAMSISTNAAGKPVITWKTLAGYTSYQVTRNGTQVAVVTAAATDTQKSWTDAGVVAGPAESVQYRVHARNADGSIASIACMPKTWTPQIKAPEFKNSSVLPSADQAPLWTTGPDGALGLKKPRIVLKWDAVPGATSYELKYRELDPATGKPLTSGFSAAADALPAASTTYIWDEGGWARSYEWFIKANAGSGQGQSAESAHITTLTHPPAPQNVNIKAEYGTGSARLTTGNNVITWDASPTASGYEIWKYTSGGSGSVTRIGQLNAAARTFTDPQPYGSEVTYYVAAINDGPRGNTSGKASSANPEAGVVAATGVMPTVSYATPAKGSIVVKTASYRSGDSFSIDRVVDVTPGNPAPKPVSQLQYPPVPADNQSRDWDGYNELKWNPTLSATGYQVARFTKSGVKSCLTNVCGTESGGGITATSLKDPAAKGSQSDYAVIAYNATGLSVEFSAKETLTQRPAAPDLKLVRAPSLTQRTADFQIVQNADAGNTGNDRFCTTNTCAYELKKSTALVSKLNHTQSGAQVNWTNADSPDGSTTTFTARSKNEAKFNDGYSDANTKTINTYPGVFSVRGKIGDMRGGQVARYRLSVIAMEMGYEQNGATTVEWGSVPGANKVDVVRKSLGGDVVGDAASGLSLGAVRSMSYYNGNGGVWDDFASPGAIFQYEITATAPNGLKRTTKSQPVLTPADISKAGTMVVTCSGTDTRVFSGSQVGSIADGSFFRGAYSVPYPYQKVAAQMVWSDGAHASSLDGAARYGYTRGTDYLGLASWGDNYWSPKNLYYTGWNYTLLGMWGPVHGDFASGPGVGYYQGMSSGFYAVSRGATHTLTDPDTGQARFYQGPDSYYVNPNVQTLATFQVDCAPAGATGAALQEPLDACYTFNGQACNNPAFWNRPQWVSR